MKKTFLMIAMVLSSQFALATSPMKPALPLAEISVGVFFAPPGSAGQYTTTVYWDGKIIAKDNKGNQTLIATLAPSAVEKLEQQIAEVQDGKLEKEEGPECMDAPTTSYSVIKSNGDKIMVKQTAGCRDSVLQSAWSVIRILESIQLLSNQLD